MWPLWKTLGTTFEVSLFSNHGESRKSLAIWPYGTNLFHIYPTSKDILPEIEEKQYIAM